MTQTKLVLAEGVFKKLVTFASTLLTDMTLLFTEESLHLGQLDSSMSCRLWADLDSNEFEVFEGFFEGLELCIGMDVLSKISKSLKDSGKRKVELDVDFEQKEATITLCGHGSTCYVPPLLRIPDSAKIKGPDLAFDFTCEIAGSRLKESFKRQIGETAHFEIREDRFDVLSTDITKGESRDNIPNDSKVFKSFELKKDVDIMLSLNYLNELSPLYSISDYTKIEMKTNSPAKMSSQIGKNGRIGFILAPRVKRQ